MTVKVAGMLAALVLLGWTGVAQADVEDDNPAAASRAPGQVTVFIRGADGSLQYSDLGPNGWSPWGSAGGLLGSGPGAAGYTSSVSVAYVKGAGTSTGMFQHNFPLTPDSPWYSIGGSMLSAPGVSVRKGSVAYIDTYYRGVDNGIVARAYIPGQGWTDENTTALAPGKTLSAPALVSRGDGLLDVFVRGTDDHVYRNWWSGAAWSGWGELPGGMTTAFAPAVTTRVTGTMDVFVRSPAGDIRWSSFDGAAWSAWKPITGIVDSGPGVVADSASRIYLFARRGGDVVWNLWNRGLGPDDGWSGWQSLHPPPPAPAPPPACDPAAGRVTGHSHIVRFGHRPTVTGRARRVDGAPLVSATVRVTTANGSWSGTAVAASDGRYKVRLPAGPSRLLRIEALAPGASSLACTNAVVKTRAGVTLKATRRVLPGGRVRFKGRLLGRPIPARGKLVELQAFDGGRWRTFAQPRARGKGRFKAAYRLRRTFGPRTFRFRARVRSETGYPYALGYSRAVRVHVL